MGFMDGLLDVLSGPMAVKQIDQHGFDFREKRAQDEAARQQQRQQWDQANQDYTVKAMAEASLGGMEEGDLQDLQLARGLDENARAAGTEQGPGPTPDLSAMRRRASINDLLTARARGQSAQSKSSLAGQKAQTDYYLQSGKDAAAMEREKYKGELRQSLLAQAEEIRANQQMSPREKEAALIKINSQMQLFDRAEAGRNFRAANFGAGSRRRIVKIPGTRDGVAGTVLRDQDTFEELGFEPAAPTAGTRGKEEAKGAAMTAYESIRGLRKQLPTPEGWIEANLTGIGREIGAKTQANPVANRYKASIRGFVPLMARALGHVGVLTELDVERTEALFSGLGATAETDRISDEMMRGIMTGQVPFQFGQGGGKPIGYMDENGEFHEMGGGGGGGTPPRAPAGGGGTPKPRKKYDPVTGTVR